MILKILRLTLHSDAPMHGDAAKLRGFFATSFNEYALLHQHMTDKLIYRYPLIQYKMLDGSPLVLGINEGAEILKEIYDKFDEIKLGDSNYTIMERGVTVKSEEFGCTEEILSYRFASPWLQSVFQIKNTRGIGLHQAQTDFIILNVTVILLIIQARMVDFKAP